MSFLKIQKNERDCLAMLALDSFNTKCNAKILNDYICSHFWLKKL